MKLNSGSPVITVIPWKRTNFYLWTPSGQRKANGFPEYAW